MDIKLRRFGKLYTIVLIVFIVEATGSTSNDTSPERRQYRVTGRIVKLYSGTKPEPIQCAGEGFQADLSDCAVFYRCMKSGSGKYTVFRFQCGPGTVYDPETEVCNHPRSTKRSECGGLLPLPAVDRIDYNEIEGTLNEIPSPITNKPIRIESTTGARSTFTTVNPWTVSSSTIPAHTSTKRHAPDVSTVFTSPFPWGSTQDHTNLPQNIVTSHQQYTMVSKSTSPPMTSAIPKSNSRDNICTSNGFIGDSENCRKFYRCVGNQRGTYTRFEFSCSESTVWDDDTQSCNHAWAVKRSRCGRSNQDSLFTKNTENPQQDSSTDKTIQQQLQVSFGSKVTQTQTQISNGSVIQNQTQINYGDRLNQNKDTKAKQNQTQISHGSAVSQTQTQIDYSDKGVQTQLQIDHSQQASQMQVQVHDSTTAGPSTSAATSTTHSSAQSGNNCERSGFMGDTNDCKKFYRCIDNGRGGYTKFEFSCGEGTVWDQSIEACNHPWAVKDCGGIGPTETTSSTQAAISTSQSTQNYYTTASTENPHTTSNPIDTEDNEDSGYGHQNQNPTTSSTWSSTTVGSTTSTKSPSNGNCQSSGFIGDANDCKIFYRCVEDGKGGYTKYEFKCGEGTVWDPHLEACNHAWAVKRCGGNASPDISNVETTTEQQNMVSTAHTQSTIVTQSPIETIATQNDDYDTGYGSANNDFTTSTTTTTKKPQNQEPSVGTICTSSGFMGDENDCKKFYRCVDNGNGGYNRYEFSCGEGTVWDSKIEACNHAWAVEKCGGSAVDHQEDATQAKPTTTHEVIDSSSPEGDLSTSSSTLQPSSPSSTFATESVTSVPVSSTDCEKSGFTGDQKDCKKFYRCVDNGKGSFTKYEFSCGEGTVWDEKIEACNHAWAVEKCGGTADSSTSHHETTTQYHPTMSDEIDNGYPSNIDTESDITTQTSTTHSTTQSSKEPSEGNNCVNSGFIGDKNDCKKFYRCVDDGNGKYIRYEFTCGEGTLWDQSIEACNHAWAVKDCGKTGESTTHPSSESPSQSTLTTETEDQGYPQSTEKTSTSTVSSYPDSETGEACSKEGFMGDKRNCKKFYRCVDNGQGFTKYEFTCGEGTYWSQEILACDHATPDKTCGGNESSSSTQTSHPEHDEIYTEATSVSSSSTIGNEIEHQTQQPPVSSGMCLSEGFYGDPNDCKKFYRCVDNGKGGYTKYDFTCGDGTAWDQEIQACNHESSTKKCSTGSPSISHTTEKQPDAGNNISMTTVSQIQHSTEKTETTSISSSNQCSSEGFLSVPNDCKKFIRCVSNDKGGYTKYEFTCGEGTIWVQEILACDHDTGDMNCSSLTTSKPLTTEGHQQPTENNEVVTSTSETPTIDKQEDEYDNGNSDKPSQSGSGVCSSEGFYGNENDCRQFYRCVDNGQGGFTKYDFTCGDGTAWDSEIQACNHIDQVETCHGASGTQPVMHDEDYSPSTESSSTASSSTTSSGTTSAGTTTTSATSSSTAVTGSNQGSNSGNKDKCDREGYFGNSQDCKKFYRCVDNGKGGYTKYDFDCGEGTIWDQDVTTCNHPQDVVHPSCNQNQDGSTKSTTAVSSSSSESSSTTESSLSGDASSSTSSSSQSTKESTQGSSNCSQEDTSKKPTNQNITCEKAGYYANPNDCKKFYRCVDWDGDGKRFSVYHFDCGEGTIWDPAVETCNHEESVYPPRDCSGSQAQNENQPSATEGTTTTQQETTSSQDSSSTQTTTQSSTEQTTQSTTSEPTTTQQSTSTEKTTTQQTTTSEQTTTQKSTTTEQTTQKSTTSEQTTQSATSEQTTQQTSSSEQTTTQQSTTSEQTTTQQPTISEQTTTQQSTTSELTTTDQSTTSEQTTTEQSTTSEQTTTQKSTTSDQTTTEKSTTTEQTTTQQSTTSEQTTQEPTTSEQTTQESTTSEQTTQASTTTEQSTTSEQTTTEQSSSTTESSTTEQSTTQQSTTTEQSEQTTTEETTSSEGTTTQQSTTQQSTTEQTTESTTTTVSGTDESTSEKKCPETDENQSLFVCPTSFKRHPKYCNLFYQCDEDDDTHDVKIAVFTCPNNTIYDESQIRCVEESKADKKCDGKIAQKRRFKRLDRNYKEPLVVTKESHACPSAGYFSFEKDSECSPAFLKCKTDKSNKLRGLVYQCPSGFVYWSISKRCEPMNRVRDCKRSQNNWTGRWEIPVERRNVAPS